MSPQVTPAVTEAGTTSGSLLRVDDLRVHFQLQHRLLGLRRPGLLRAVDGVSFEVPRGRTLGLVGESGCGKTTTAKAILRLVPIQSGHIELDGVDLGQARGSALRQMRRRMQMIFQDPFASLNPRLTVARILREPLDIHAIGSRQERRARVDELLELVGLGPRVADRYPHEFSGGQRQRIGVARALALHPDLVVADEPISALDVSIQAQITNLLQELQERLGLTYLYIAHDLAVVRHISHQVAVMYLGEIVEMADTTELFEQPTHPYTIALLSAVPVPDPELERRRRRIILAGEVPSASDPPSGCHFRTRCWLRQRLGDPEICVTTEPVLAGSPRLAPGHRVACHFVEESLSSDERASVTAATRSAADAHRANRGLAATLHPMRADRMKRD